MKFFALLLAGASLLLPVGAQAQETAPDVLVKNVTEEVLDVIRKDKDIKAGSTKRAIELVEQKVLPHFNFTRMTASATGPGWRRATPEQRQKLQQEFKTLLVHTYAGALRQVSDQTVEVRPLRAAADDAEVVVRTWVKGRGEPVQLDYRLERTPGQGSGWKIYDLNVLGVWLVDNYRPQFAQQINAGGIDALIRSLAERNQANAGSSRG